MLKFSAPDTLAIMPLRAGSKGLHGKNVRPLAGKPLYRHSVDQALRVIGRCIISTDIPAILRGSMPTGCEVVARPPDLALDETPITPVLLHLFEHLQNMHALPKTAVLMQATSPLRRDEDIRDALTLYETGRFELVMSVVRTDPAVLKYGFATDGQFTPISKPEFCFSNRQSLPEIARPNGAIYVFDPRTFMKTGSLATPSIGAIEMPENRSIDIDTLADLNAAEDVLRRYPIPLAS